MSSELWSSSTAITRAPYFQTSPVPHQLTTVGLTSALHIHDRTTHHHCMRVAATVRSLCEALGLSEDRTRVIEFGALLHDVGKIAVPAHILTKPARLNVEERKQIRTHPVAGARIIQNLGLSQTISDIVLYHHERYDGAGYPYGLCGPEIPLAARVVAVVDAFDAMTAIRNYRSPRSEDEALAEVEREAGLQFDPRIARMFVRLRKSAYRNEAPTHTAQQRSAAAANAPGPFTLM